MQGEKTLLLLRFRSVEGHLQAVIEMVEQDQPCEQVLYQLLSIRGALDSLLSLIIKKEVKRSLDTLRKEACPERQAQEFDRLVSLHQYSRR